MIDNPYMFTGRRWDSESGTYYYRARQYNPLIGRFLQRDPIGYYDSLNLYQYVGNNPLNYLDPWGLLFIAPPGGKGRILGRILGGSLGQLGFGLLGKYAFFLLGTALGLGSGAFVLGAFGYFGGKVLGGYVVGKRGSEWGSKFDNPCEGSPNCDEPNHSFPGDPSPKDPEELMCLQTPGMCQEIDPIRDNPPEGNRDENQMCGR